MGESRTSSGRALGRLAALGFASAALGFPPFAAAQAKSPAGDKGGARGVAGNVVHYQESPSTSVIYLEQSGGLVAATPPPVERNGATAVADAKSVPPKTASKTASTAVVTPTNRGNTTLRASQPKVAASQTAATRP